MATAAMAPAPAPHALAGRATKAPHAPCEPCEPLRGLALVLERDAQTDEFAQPDLLDAVVEALDVPTALALRGTCRSLNAVVRRRLGARIDARMRVWRAPDVARRASRVALLLRQLTPLADCTAALGDAIFGPTVAHLVRTKDDALRKPQPSRLDVIYIVEQTARLREQALALVRSGALAPAALDRLAQVWMRSETPRLPRHETFLGSDNDVAAIRQWHDAHVATPTARAS